MIIIIVCIEYEYSITYVYSMYTMYVHYVHSITDDNCTNLTRGSEESGLG